MGQVTKPNTFSPNTTISSTEVNDNFDTIYDEFNGNINDANLADSAVTTAKINASAVTAAKVANAVLDETKLTTAAAQGWYALGDTPDTVTYNGNRSYDLVFNSNDLTDTVSNGMRLKLTRTVTAPTQCTDLEASSSQYYSKTSPAGTTFTDDFVAMAWIKLESYGSMSMISRYNGTSGWDFRISSDGRVILAGVNGGAANASNVESYQSVPLGRWVHVAAQLDMSAFTATSTTSYIMIDGVDVPAQVARGGTNPTALIQAGNLEVGGRNGGLQPFDGKIAQAAYFSAKVLQATIPTYISQGLSGSETSVVSAYSFNNSIADLNTSNANDLSAQNSAVATATDSPFADRGNVPSSITPGTVEYAVVTKAAFSTNTTLTVQVPEGCAIPTSGGVSAVSYSTQDVPYGFPRDKGRWTVTYLGRGSFTQSSPSASTWYNLTTTSGTAGGMLLKVPIGQWILGYFTNMQGDKSAATNADVYSTLSTANNTESDTDFTNVGYVGGASGTQVVMTPSSKSKGISVSSSTPYYLNTSTATASQASIRQRGDLAPIIIFAECAYV